jgi:hypothetical protein
MANDDAPAMVSISFERVTLSNGLDVILHQSHTIPLVAVNVWYHVGSKDEAPGRTGFAHLFEHVMFEGSKHHNRIHFEPLQKAGATLNGSTTAPLMPGRQQGLFIFRGSGPFPRLRGKVRMGGSPPTTPVHGHKFRRQRPIGPSIVDFVCLEQCLVIEVDGSQHLERASLDARRDDYLESLGFRVLRFWDNQVLNETDAIIEVIAQFLENREEGPPS